MNLPKPSRWQTLITGVSGDISRTLFFGGSSLTSSVLQPCKVEFQMKIIAREIAFLKLTCQQIYIVEDFSENEEEEGGLKL